MNKDIKKQWVDALRSGKYTQGFKFMRKDNGTFCALGVLCDLVDPSLWTRTGDGTWRHDGYSAIPSDSALKALAQEMDPVETQQLDLKIASGDLSVTGKPATGGRRVTRKGGVVMRHSSTRRRSKRDKTRSGARPRGYLNRTMRIKM